MNKKEIVLLTIIIALLVQGLLTLIFYMGDANVQKQIKRECDSFGKTYVLEEPYICSPIPGVRKAS